MAETKDDLLDLDDISGGKKETAPLEKKKAKSSRKPRASKPKVSKNPCILAVPDINDSSFTGKDINECTGEEFLRWTQCVYPYVTATPEEFEDNKNKQHAFKQIVAFHRQGLAWLRSSQLEKEETFH